MSSNGRDDRSGFLFDPGNEWDEEWQNMPEFEHEDQTSFKAILVHFATRADMEAFSRLVAQPLTTDTRSIWFPPAPIGRYADKRYADEEPKGTTE